MYMHVYLAQFQFKVNELLSCLITNISKYISFVPMSNNSTCLNVYLPIGKETISLLSNFGDIFPEMNSSGHWNVDGSLKYNNTSHL